MRIAKIVISTILLLVVIGVIVNDSAFHFRKETVEKRRKHHAPQKHWNLWYGQSYVYYDSPLRYESDFDRLQEIIIPGYSVWSDLATSYYLVAALPVYVGNIHRHHGGQIRGGVKNFLETQHLCFIKDSFHLLRTKQFFYNYSLLSQKHGWPAYRYILLNKDKQNSLLRRDCMPMLSRHLEADLLQISQLLYEGEYLNLYELNTFSVEPK